MTNFDGMLVLKNLKDEFQYQEQVFREQEHSRRVAKDEMFAQLNKLRMFADNVANEDIRCCAYKKNEFEQLLLKCSSEIRNLIMSLNCVDRKIDFMQDRWSRWRDKLDEINENWRRQDV